jgi:alpha-glucosidase
VPFIFDLRDREKSLPVAKADASWWRDAVIYQVYLRSFADGDGDGDGDIAGLRQRLPYLAALGVDAIWVNPWYPSPMVDGGYDVADYRAIDPRYGTLDDATKLVQEAHEHGLRVLVDLVPNHTSDQHQWFRDALAAPAGSPERQRYLFRPGRGRDGVEPPNDWRSVFGGLAWTRAREPDGSLGEWYLHLFAPEQPDLNWDNPEIHAEFESILRFWFDLGIDGIRIDVANSLVKHPDLPDLAEHTELLGTSSQDDHPYWDRDGVHDIFRRWREIADGYAPPRMFVAEAWVDGQHRLARYLRPGQLNTAFNLQYLTAPWQAEALRVIIEDSVEAHGAVGAAVTWVLSNHDTARHLSRYARHRQDGHRHSLAHLPAGADLALGERRARAALLLTLALPGAACLYQGEELGLWEVEDLPDEVLQDPTWERSGRTDRGRDGCRVPLPWSGDEPPFGFSSGQPWLPQPAGWRAHTAASQDGDGSSMLEFYRRALRVRRERDGFGDGTLSWLDARRHSIPSQVLAFARNERLVCAVNFGEAEWPLPDGAEVLLASGPVDGGTLPADTAVWLLLAE